MRNKNTSFNIENPWATQTPYLYPRFCSHFLTSPPTCKTQIALIKLALIFQAQILLVCRLAWMACIRICMKVLLGQLPWEIPALAPVFVDIVITYKWSLVWRNSWGSPHKHQKYHRYIVWGAPKQSLQQCKQKTSIKYVKLSARRSS